MSRTSSIFTIINILVAICTLGFIYWSIRYVFIQKILAKLNQERVKNLTQSSKHQFTVVVKKDCPTCEMIESALVELVTNYPGSVSIYVQDDPSFPKAIESTIDDTSLEFSYKNNIEIVPTLICSVESKETNRTIGWDK